jgi:hypothetical protein
MCVIAVKIVLFIKSDKLKYPIIVFSNPMTYKGKSIKKRTTIQLLNVNSLMCNLGRMIIIFRVPYGCISKKRSYRVLQLTQVIMPLDCYFAVIVFPDWVKYIFLPMQPQLAHSS